MTTVAKVGLIADVQYADCEDGSDFAKTVVRRFRHSKKVFERAVNHWYPGGGGTEDEDKSKDGICLVMQLGDFVDGRTKNDNSQMKCLHSLLQAIPKGKESSWIHLIGNHELYCFGRSGAEQHLSAKPSPQNTPAAMGVEGSSATTAEYPKVLPSRKSYYTVQVAPGWTFIVLDPYEISLIDPAVPEDKDVALALLKQHNPNDVTTGCNWKAGLKGLDLRWVPYNGAMGDSQIEWVVSTLTELQQQGQKAILFSHIPLMPGTCDNSCLLWNYDKVLESIDPFLGNTVVGSFAGHDHPGGSEKSKLIVNEPHEAKESHGALFMTLPSPLEIDENDDAYADLTLLDNGHFVVEGHGSAKAWRNALPHGLTAMWPPVAAEGK